MSDSTLEITMPPNHVEPNIIMEKNVPLARQIVLSMIDVMNPDKYRLGHINRACLAIVAAHTEPEEFEKFVQSITALPNPLEQQVLLRQIALMKQMTDLKHLRSSQNNSHLEQRISGLQSTIQTLQHRIETHSVTQEFLDEVIVPFTSESLTIGLPIEPQKLEGRSFDTDLINRTINTIFQSAPTEI